MTDKNSGEKMNAPDDGGFAFPSLDSNTCGLALRNTGMTLRDYFAAKALEGWLAGTPANEPVHNEAVALRAYAIADAMLKARGGPQ